VLGYVNGYTVIAGIRIVKRYRINALVRIEKRPRVSIVTGKLIILRIGFNTINIAARTSAPIKSVSNPP
jgi:hypothetical protein